MKKIDLSGMWQVRLDASQTLPLQLAGNMLMKLPGTTSAAGLGPENCARETGHLTDTHPFEGNAWFVRTFTARGWEGLQAMLTLERTRMTTVYIDGQHLGSCKSLTTPHRYVLPALADGDHTLSICVSNKGYPTKGGHLTSPDTQSNWNGITGEISITLGEVILTGIRVLSSHDLHSLHILADVIGPASGQVTVDVAGSHAEQWHYTDGKIDGQYTLQESLPLWAELSPIMQTLTLTVGTDSYNVAFGLRNFHAKGRKLLCNDREVFLRGKHDGLLFPSTGYAPCDIDSWRRVMTTAQSYGINHYRFHTCCPTDAAFTVADELGIFMEPELPFWGTITEEGEEGYNPEEQAYLMEEGFRILREYGHHPSFVMFSMGNELWGSKAALNRMLADYRNYDSDRLYISGSNNFQFAPDILAEEDIFVGVRLSHDRLIRGSYAMCDAPQGIVQTTAPESVSTFDEMIAPQQVNQARAVGKVLIQYGTNVKEVAAETAQELIPQIPVIAHEVGQYEFYPDFQEIDKYTGPLKARNFEVFRERLIHAGLYDQHEKYFKCAGKLAIDCYRREIEAMLRSSELAGFQLLDLQDFSGQGTALVGVLNAFMESKGLITPVEWRRFCAGTVVLGEFERFALQDGDSLRFGVQVSECDSAKRHAQVVCTLQKGDTILMQEVVKLGKRAGRLTEKVIVDMGKVSTDVPCKLQLLLKLEDGTENIYPLWVFPKVDVQITPEGIFTAKKQVRFIKNVTEATHAKDLVLVIPDSAGKLPAEYCTDFWCFPMFNHISLCMHKPTPTGTLGLCIDKEDTALAGFPAEDYTTPPWYPILAHAHCEPLDALAVPVVEMIDNVERCQRLGILYRKDGYMHLTARLWENADMPEVKAFALSLLNAL